MNIGFIGHFKQSVEGTFDFSEPHRGCLNTAAKITLLVATLFVVGFFIHLGIAFYRTCCSINATKRPSPSPRMGSGLGGVPRAAERPSPPPQTGSVLEIISGGVDRRSVERELPKKTDENPVNKYFEIGMLAIWSCSFIEGWEKLWMSWALLYYPYGAIAGQGGGLASEEERAYVFKFLEEDVKLASKWIDWIRNELEPETNKPFKERTQELTDLKEFLLKLKKQIGDWLEKGGEINRLQEQMIQFERIIAQKEGAIEEFENQRAKLLKLMEFSEEIGAYAKEDRAIVCAIFMFQRGWWSGEQNDQARCEKILTRFQKDGLLTLEDCQLVRKELERCKDLTWAQFQEEDPERYKCCLETLEFAWHQGPGFIAQRSNKKGVKTPLID